MGIKGIDHWVIVARDLPRTLDFYERLGFTIAWEKRPGRPDMATIRINDAQKINVHGPDAPARPGYLGARRPTAGGADFCHERDGTVDRSEEHTSELQSRLHLVCRLLLEKKKKTTNITTIIKQTEATCALRLRTS